MTEQEKEIHEALGEIEFDTFMQVAETAFCLGYLGKQDWKKSMLDDIANGELSEKWRLAQPLFFEIIADKLNGND